ncbi:MAG: 2-enoyl thioester reductase domain-containing protein [Verrucomicrobiota bacterium]
MKSRHLVFSQFGTPSSVVNLEAFTLSPLKKGEVLLEIQASPINPADLNFIEGTYGVKPELPATAGIECVASVLESHSELFSPGDIVMPLSRIGGWADHAITQEQNLIRLPSGIDLLQAAMLKVNPATAFLLLTHFETLQSGDWVALNAANSGVGQCTIQLAKHFGIRTLCFLRNTSLISELKNLGATEVFEDSPAGYASAVEALGHDQAKLAFNAVGGESALRIMKLLGTSGTHITYGAMAKKPLTVPNGPLIFNDIRLRGLWVTQWIRNSDPTILNQTYAELAELVLCGKLTQTVDSTFDLADFSQALARLNQPNRLGKVIFHKNL